jgi:hypothetical protein
VKVESTGFGFQSVIINPQSSLRFRLPEFFFMRSIRRLLLVFCAVLALPAKNFAGDTSNTISRDSFNFGHQLGYMYSRMDDAYFKDGGAWSFQTGFLSFYTPDMPLVRNPFWKERLILMIPLYFDFYPCSAIEIEAELTDLFIEFPYVNINNMGGKSPRFKTKMRLLKERDYLPAIAFTVGVKFSSAKPYTIWDNHHNYDQSNGLAGACTGVADYLLLFTFSKKLGLTTTVDARLGLAPLGSPVEYSRGSAQADEIPYGIAIRRDVGRSAAQFEISGMYNGLPATILAHYSVARLQLFRDVGRSTFVINLERGLTRETDTWVGGFYVKFNFNKK